MTVLRELVRRMGADNLVAYDYDVLQSLESQGLAAATIPDALAELVDHAFLDRVGYGMYHVTHDGEMTIPTGQTKREAPRRRTMAEKVADRREQREAARLRLLDAVYELTEGNPHGRIEMAEAFEAAGLSYPEGRSAAQFLARENLLGEDSGHTLHITHSGVKEREQAIAGGGEKATEHFPAATILHVVQNFHGAVGSVQTGGQGNIANVHQSVGIAGADIVQLTEQLRDAAREHGDFVLKTAERVHELAKSKEPDKTEMKFLLKGFETIVALAPLANAVAVAIAGVGV